VVVELLSGRRIGGEVVEVTGVPEVKDIFLVITRCNLLLRIHTTSVVYPLTLRLGIVKRWFTMLKCKDHGDQSRWVHRWRTCMGGE
jgi:hypothetical protein